MDSRLSYHHGQRLMHLRRSDLPQVALGIVGATLKLVQSERGVHGTTPFVRLSGRGINVVIRGDDWSKIVPYLENGVFNPQVVAPDRIPYLQPEFILDIATLDSTDKDF